MIEVTYQSQEANGILRNIITKNFFENRDPAVQTIKLGSEPLKQAQIVSWVNAPAFGNVSQEDSGSQKKVLCIRNHFRSIMPDSRA